MFDSPMKPERIREAAGWLQSAISLSHLLRESLFVGPLRIKTMKLKEG